MRARLDRLAKCDSEQARAKEHKAGCDYRWESIGHEVMIAHGRLPLGVLVTISIVLRQLEQNDTRGGLCIARRSYFVGPHRIDHAHGYNSDYYRSEHRHFNCPRSRCLSVGLVNLLVERRPPKPELKRLESMQYRFKARRYPCQKPSQRRRRKIPSDGRPIDGSLNARSRSAVAYTASQHEGASPPLARW